MPTICVFGRNEKQITIVHLKIVIITAVKLVGFCIGVLTYTVYGNIQSNQFVQRLYRLFAAISTMVNKLASFKKGNQYARQQHFENLGILITNKTVVITCTSNFAAISREYIFIVSKIVKNMVQ